MNYSAMTLIIIAIICWVPSTNKDIAKRVEPRLEPKTPRAGPAFANWAFAMSSKAMQGRAGLEEPPRNEGKLRLLWSKVLPQASPVVDPLVIAGDIELFVACVRAGLSVQQATSAVSIVADEPTATYWIQVNSLLALGVEPERAWVHMSQLPGLQELARLVVMSEHSGAAIASGCQRLVDTLRADATSNAIAKAERAGVFISLPLAMCFLPAFIVLGLVPVVISLGAQLL